MRIARVAFALKGRGIEREYSLDGEHLLNERALKLLLERMIEITADLSKFPEVPREHRYGIGFLSARRKIEFAAKGRTYLEFFSFRSIHYADFPRYI